MNESELTYESYLGTGWDFPPAFTRSNHSVKMVSDEEDIRASLGTLLATTVGERIMQPEYGCNLFRLLFEPMNTGTRTFIKNMIERAVLFYEPRIELEDVGFENKPDEGTVLIHLRYTIMATNSRYNFVYPFYLNEANNLNT